MRMLVPVVVVRKERVTAVQVPVDVCRPRNPSGYVTVDIVRPPVFLSRAEKVRAAVLALRMRGIEPEPWSGDSPFLALVDTMGEEWSGWVRDKKGVANSGARLTLKVLPMG